MRSVQARVSLLEVTPETGAQRWRAEAPWAAFLSGIRVERTSSRSGVSGGVG